MRFLIRRAKPNEYRKVPWQKDFLTIFLNELSSRLYIPRLRRYSVTTSLAMGDAKSLFRTLRCETACLDLSGVNIKQENKILDAQRMICDRLEQQKANLSNKH